MKQPLLKSAFRLRRRRARMAGVGLVITLSAPLLVMVLLAGVTRIQAQGAPRPAIDVQNASQLTQVYSISLGQSNAIWNLAWSPDSRQVAVVDPRTVWLVDPLNPLAQPERLAGNIGWVRAAVFSPDGETLATGRNDGAVQLWDTATGASRRLLESDAIAVYSLAFSPEGSWLAAGGHEGKVYIWDVVTEELVVVLQGHEPAPVTALAFSPDGALLASGAQDNQVLVWDLATNDVRYTFSGEHADVLSLAFSPDGALLATGNARGETLKLWAVEDGQDLGAQPGQLWEVNSVAFNPVGDLLATAGIGFAEDSDANTYTVLLRDAQSQAIVMTLEGETPFQVAAFSPDGVWLASGGQDGVLRVWGLPLQR